jgi:hypothetical protein
MLINPQELGQNPDRLEGIEKVSLRLVTQAIYDYRITAQEIFREESDLVADIGEDITREALDSLGMSKIYLTRSQIAFFQRVENAGLAKNQVQICELSWWHPGTLKLRL